MLIYKIFRTNEWIDLQISGQTSGAPIDLQDGFIHFSTAKQVTETATKHFPKVKGLVLLACDTDTLGDALKWEVSRNNDLFPHLFDTLRLADVVWTKPLPLVDDVHVFPESLK